MKKCRKNVEVSSNQLVPADSAKRIRNNILPAIFIVCMLVIFAVVLSKVIIKIKNIDNDLNIGSVVFEYFFAIS